MHARVAWAALLALVCSLAGVAPATAAGPTLDPVPSVTASSPEPDLLVATWSEPASGAPELGYAVRVRSLDDAVVQERSTTGVTESFTLTPGEYYVTVAAVSSAGETAETSSTPVTVSSLVRTGTVSGSVVRPYRDGFQDSVTLRATSSIETSARWTCSMPATTSSAASSSPRRPRGRPCSTAAPRRVRPCPSGRTACSSCSPARSSSPARSPWPPARSGPRRSGGRRAASTRSSTASATPCTSRSRPRCRRRCRWSSPESPAWRRARCSAAATSRAA